MLIFFAMSASFVRMKPERGPPIVLCTVDDTTCACFGAHKRVTRITVARNAWLTLLAIGSAAVIVLSQHDTAMAAARNMMRFFAHESCGQCTPCRNGTAKASALIEQKSWDVDLLADLSAVMRDSSICGLGQAAPNPVDCVVKYFPQELV